ncbi:MAG TPA: peptide deformylase [Candidatus Binatia bacterium]|nr:peptide deformylase [Candidatus Binatia bacterium]
MAVREVRSYGDPVLRQKARPVTEVTAEIRALIADMVETMHHEIGVGLAAPQIGIALRLVVMDDGKGKARALVNPEITDRRGSVVAEEGCLSVPGIFAEVERSEWIRVEAADEDGKPVAIELRGFLARVVQHEMDHLDGVLFIDRLPPVARDRIKKRIQREGLPAEGSHRAFAL